jgi:hypothetical protein
MLKSILPGSPLQNRLSYGYIATVDSGGTESRVTFANKDGSVLLGEDGNPLSNIAFNYTSKEGADTFVKSHAYALANLHRSRVLRANNLQNDKLEAVGWAPPGQVKQTHEGPVVARTQNIKGADGKSLT